MIQEVSLSVESDAQTAHTALKRLARMVAGIFSSAAVAVALLDPQSGDLITRAAEGFPSGAHRPARIPLLSGLEGWVAAHQQAVFLADTHSADTHNDAHFGARALHPWRTVMCVPLAEEDRLLGTLLVASARPHAFDARQHDLLLSISGILAGAVHGRQRAEAERGQARELAAILETARALAGSLETNQVIEATLGGLRRVTRCDEAIIYVYDARAEHLHALADAGERFQRLRDRPITLGDERSLAAWVARSRHARLLDPGDGEGSNLAEAKISRGMALLAAPILCRDRVRGVAVVARASAFTREELATALNLCDFAACALDNVERYQAAHLERLKLATIFDSASDGMAVVDESLTVVEANVAFGELVQQPQAELLGRSCCDVLLRTSPDTCGLCDGECLLARTLQGGDAIPHIECEFLPTGAQQSAGSSSGAHPPNRIVDFSLTPLVGPAGRQVLLVGRDVTAARAMEQVKGQFLSMISHELRAPLQTINGFMDLLLSGSDGDLSEQHRELLQRARAGSEHLTSLVDDLLFISRRDAGQFSLNLREIDLGRAIVETVEEMELMAVAVPVTLTFESPRSLPLVRADETRMRQVLRNLVSNAIKFTPPGGRVTVSTQVVEGQLALSVRDSGVGISDEHQVHIFERFYQVDPTRDHGRFQGQGLGLAIVRIIVEGHGGKIQLSSSLGQGSTFTVLLPLAADDGE
jgi:nitrogen-specific signal transduction histidine kinase/putative methionine-R-sulfoxide reductase with GAF domain